MTPTGQGWVLAGWNLFGYIRSSAFRGPKWRRTTRTTRTDAGDPTAQDEEAALPVALPPPGSLDGNSFPCVVLITEISRIIVSTLIRIFLSFVVFHSRGGGGVLLDGVNGRRMMG